MSTPSYIATNLDELFEKASVELQDIIASGEVDTVTQQLSTTYKIPQEFQTPLSNIISFILIGAIDTDDVVQALQDLVNVNLDDALHLATDLENGILKKAHISLLKKSDGAVATLEFQGDKTKTELRKDILDKTKRESALAKSPVPAKDAPKKPAVILKPGSRSQLLEQLQVLGTIPNDDEIATRLTHIQEQISSLKKEEEDSSLTSKIALKSFMFGEQGKAVADPTIKTTYSVPPTRYTVDPYREVDNV
jgi:hypothetical protein